MARNLRSAFVLKVGSRCVNALHRRRLKDSNGPIAVGQPATVKDWHAAIAACRRRARYFQLLEPCGHSSDAGICGAMTGIEIATDPAVLEAIKN